MVINTDDTIAAVATPVGKGGIGVIKISGPQAGAVARTVFREKNSTASPLLRPRRLYAGYVIDPMNREVIDEVLLFWMPGPASYTREDVVEIQCHSGYRVLERILGVVLGQEGVRLAEAGEFTRRAFLSGRIDLTQVEAVADIIAARSDTALEQAASQLQGSLREKVQEYRQEVAAVLAQLESAIDFPEEDIDILSTGEMCRRLSRVSLLVRDLLATYEEGRRFREGVKVAILGRPNVGKSSLLNALLDEERVIVHHLPGTTRDTIEESITITGRTITFVDTAGLHDKAADDAVELKGVERTRATANGSDVVLFVVDGSTPLSKSDLDVFEEFHTKTMIVVINKTDLPSCVTMETLPENIRRKAVVSLSAKYHRNIEGLKGVLSRIVAGEEDSERHSAALINRLRHKISLEKAQAALERGLGGLEEGVSLEFAALDLREALVGFGEVAGETTPEEILDRIFSEFCIGK